MRDLRVREYKQQEAYTLIDLLSMENLQFSSALKNSIIPCTSL